MKNFLFLLLFLLISPLVQAESTLGQVDFPITATPQAQQFFMKGLLLLHSFEYEDSRDAFEEAIKLDPKCVMAYWGAAMTYNHPIWMEQDAASARALLNRLAPTAEERRKLAPTKREADWLSTMEVLYGEGTKEERDLKYEKAMEHLAETYPQDLEASIFHALSILGTAHSGRDFRIYMRAAGILEQAYEKAPEHPGVLHYMIHCYDDPIHAPLGLRPAKKYAKIAPAAAHAQHMPSHIFLALGMWPDVVASNEVAWKVSVDRVDRKKLSLDQRGYHYLYWLEYGYLQEGRFRDARKMLTIMENDAKQTGSGRAISHLIRMRAGYIIETSEWNSDAVNIPVDLSKARLNTAAIHLFATGYAAAKRGDMDQARKTLLDLQSRIKDSGGDTSDAHHMAPQPYDLDRKTVEIIADELNAFVLFAEGKKTEAIDQLTKTAEAESSLTFEFGPPEIVKPTHELLGEMLLEIKKPKEAMQQFQMALDRAPRRALSLQDLVAAASQAGDKEVETDARAQLTDVRKNADPSH